MSELLQNIQLTGSGRVCRSQLEFIRQSFLRQIQYVLRHGIVDMYIDTVLFLFIIFLVIYFFYPRDDETLGRQG